MYVYDGNLYLLNNDGKTIIVNDCMNVSRWQNITESIQKAKCCGIDGSVQAIGFTNALLKINDAKSLAYRGKYNVGQQNDKYFIN